jgi:hypothetical protein
MGDRFAELMAKAQASRLTPGETEELARLLNAPILDPLISVPVGFASKHTFEPSDVPGRLRPIEWFSQVGDPMSLDLSMPTEQVSSWPEAVGWCTDGVWQNVELSAQNQLTLWLHQHDHENYQKWNELVVQYKAAVVQPLTEEKLAPYQQARGLNSAVVSSVQWDILGALMENDYLGSGHRCFFFLELLAVYEAGHFPCGWRGEWPQGDLMVY